MQAIYNLRCSYKIFNSENTVGLQNITLSTSGKQATLHVYMYHWHMQATPQNMCAGHKFLKVLLLQKQNYIEYLFFFPINYIYL